MTRIVVAIALSLSAVVFTAPDSAAAHCTGTAVATTDDIQAKLNAGATGETFCLAAGTWTLSAALTPKTGQKLVGEGQGVTIIRGSKPITSWTLTSGLYVHTGDTNLVNDGWNCAVGTECQYRDWLLRDGSFMTRTLSPCTTTNVTTGKFCIDYGAGKMYIFDAPLNQRYISGHNFNVQGPTGIELRGLSIRQFGNGPKVTSGWVINDVEIHKNSGVGLNGPAGNVTVTGSKVSDNGVHGVTIKGDGYQLLNTEVARNNPLGGSASWHSAGIKAVNSTNVTVDGNNVHDNYGTGIWFDIDTSGVITDNTSSNNTNTFGGGDGVKVEVSCNTDVLRNTVSGNGRGGIQASDSDNVRIGTAGNGNTVTVTSASGGTFGVRIYGSGRTEVGGNYDVCNINGAVVGSTATDNNITMQTTLSNNVNGVVREGGSITGAAFSANDYHMPAADCSVTRWKWWTGSTQVTTRFSTWQGTYGQDVSGSCGA